MITLNKKQNSFSLQDDQLAENAILIFGFCEISYKTFSQIRCKIFSAQCLFTDHLKRKTLNKNSEEHSQQILANYVHISWRALQPLWLFFEACKISWFIWQSIFDYFQIFLIWIFSYFYLREMQIKQFN